MAQHENCKKYSDCTWRNDVGYCPDDCNQFKHKDEVIVVRCRDCKRRYFNEDIGEYCCEAWGDGYDTVCTDDDYCSYGEKRDET